MAVLGVKNCSKHLAQGGKKYATFISEAFKQYLKQYNEKKIRTDLVFFDGASNVQKAGQILAAYYPQITVLRGVENVLSLSFSDIEKFPVIRVRQRYSYKYTLVPYKHTFLQNTYNLGELVILGYNTEVQVHVPRLWWFLSCSTRSIFPPFKHGKQRAKRWLALRNGR